VLIPGAGPPPHNITIDSLMVFTCILRLVSILDIQLDEKHQT